LRADPAREIERVIAYLGLSSSAEQIQAAIAFIRPPMTADSSSSGGL
jgi:hypothetical protein